MPEQEIVIIISCPWKCNEISEESAMSMLNQKNRLRLVWVALTVIAVGLTALTAGLLARPASAAPAPHQNFLATTNDVCLACHGKDGFKIKLDSGETLVLTISGDQFGQSTHGQNGLSCITCHVDIQGYPHPARTMESIRDVKLKYYTSCQQCHVEQYNKTLDSYHQAALAAGNKNAAVCADCHNPHTQKPIAQLSRSEIPTICAKCHSGVYEQYKESVHGAALLDEGNPDVPTCIDCHGVHNIGDPKTVEFRLKSPTEMCGRCHTNKSMMDKYGISTQVLTTYVADFHGTTVTLFEKETPDQQTNKPVCFDCHGVHDIKRVDDPQKGLAMKKNILAVCQKCHPTANIENFTDAWLGHYAPDVEKFPLVYYVNLFYQFLIPGVLGGMAVFVISDIVRRIIDNRKGGSH